MVLSPAEVTYTSDKFIALQNLSKIKDLIIERSDKVNSVVMFDRQDNIRNRIIS